MSRFFDINSNMICNNSMSRCDSECPLAVFITLQISDNTKGPNILSFNETIHLLNAPRDQSINQSIDQSIDRLVERSSDRSID